jgi:hypothetical protein
MMEIKSSNEFVSALKQMTTYCRKIKELLDYDQIHFSSNAITSISDSNHQKTILLEKLTTLINEINSSISPALSDGFLDAIEKHAENFDAHIKTEIMAALNELKSEIQAAYQFLSTNSKIIFTNIKQLHNFWEKLSACSSRNECVYDHKGSTSI